MTGVEFNEENEFYIRAQKLHARTEDPSMVRFLVKYKIVSSRTSAFVILFLIIITSFAATWYLLNGRGIDDNYVVGPDGTIYDIEEYIRLVDQGNDPLSPQNIRANNIESE